MSLSVNVSPRTLEAAEVSATTFLAILRRHGDRAGPDHPGADGARGIRHPDRLRAALTRHPATPGVRIAADDVGAGNAGLRLLSQFRFDVVKIDLSLVQRGSDDQTPVGPALDRRGRRPDGRHDHRRGRRDLRPAADGARARHHAGQGYLLGRPGPDPT